MANDGGTTIGPDDGRVAAEPSAPSAKPRWRELPFLLLVGVLVVAVASTGTVWWVTHRGPDLSVGSKHRVTVEVSKVGTGDCWNNIAGVTIGGHYWYTGDHAPEDWGIGDVSGTFEVTATPPNPGEGTAVFTADQGGTAAFKGGYLHGFDPLLC